MKKNLFIVSMAAVLLHASQAAWGQAPPPLGVAASFALFTAVGEVKNAGPTVVNGNIGTNAGAFSGFPPGVINNGNALVASTYTTQAATDVQTAYGYFSANIPCVTSLAIYGGTPAVTLLPGSYCVTGATTLAGTLILDAGGVANAKFYLRVSGGALTTAANSVVVLAGGATADNVYWQVSGGAVNLGQNSTMQGTLLVDGAISMAEGTTLIGRGLSRAGAILPTSTPSFISTFSLPTVTSTSWLGTANGGLNTDWYTAANWSKGVPTSTLEAIVPTGTIPYPVIGSGSAVAQSLTIGSTASFTQGGGTLDVLDAIDNSGTISATGGTVALRGAAAQRVGGNGSTRFWNLTVANNAGVNQTGALSVHGVLALASGGLRTNGQPLTLLSDVLGTALVVQNAGNEVTGPVTVQRYIDGSLNSGAGYRHYAAPVSGSTVADLATGGFTPVVNPAYNSAAIPSQVRAFPTVFGFDEARITTSGNPTPQDFDKGFFSPGALTDALTPGQGYVVNINAAETVDFVGPLNNGDIARTGLARGGQTESGWQLLGNPYPSPISWTTTYNDGAAGLDNAVYVAKSTGPYAGGYASYVNGVGANGGTDRIATGQGFFVRVAAAGTPGALTFKNSGRLTAYASPAFQRGDATTAPLVRLALRNAAGRADEAVVYFDAAATAGFDAALDAYKLDPAGSTMALATAGAEPLAIDARPALGTADVLVPLSVQAEAGRYALAAAELLRLPTGTKAFLRDALTGSVTDLSQQPSYPFAVTAGASATGRFSLLLTTQGVLATAPAALSKQVNVFPNPARGTVSVGLPASLSRQAIGATLVNALGQTVLRATLPAGATSQLALPGVARGVYTLRLLTADGTVSKRLIVE